MLLAEVEIRHSRPVAPTRRVALGLTLLPTDPLPGWGPVLLGGLLAANVGALDADELPDLYDLIDDLEAGNRIAQPKLRHRFQKDTVGLDRSRHSLIGEGEHVWFDLDDHALPEVNILGALYAAAGIEREHRPIVFRVVRKAVQWEKSLDAGFVAHLLGDDAAFSRWRALPTDERWALRLLGFGPDDRPLRADIQSAFRDAVSMAHPDRGGSADSAGQRIVELTQARRVLLGG
jgi:hypothetical protein